MITKIEKEGSNIYYIRLYLRRDSRSDGRIENTKKETRRNIHHLRRRSRFRRLCDLLLVLSCLSSRRGPSNLPDDKRTTLFVP